MGRPITKGIAHFFDNFQIKNHCWLWCGTITKAGYGQFKIYYKSILAHRFSYELFVAPIEPGKHILHRRECGNRNCVNPDHLYMGTHTDNMRDMVIWGNLLMGEEHGSSKLSEEDVLNIRRTRRDKGYSYQIIADIFNISKSHAYQIISGKNWKHLL